MPRILMERSGEMEVFARIVTDGGFSAAGRSLGLTSSAVSKVLARLEARLGARLLTRTTRAVSLTEEGAAYFEAAQSILREMAEADEAAGSGAIRGSLSVNATLPFGRLVVAPAIPSFLEQNPGVTVSLSFTDDVVDLLAQQADVAVRMGNLPDSALIARKLGQSRRVICAAPDYLARRGTPSTPADLSAHDCLTFNFRRARPGWPVKIDGAVSEQAVAGSIKVNNGETLRQMTLQGCGVARLGYFHVADDIAKGALVPLLETFNPGDLELMHAIYVGGGPAPARVKAFVDHLARWVSSLSLFV
ncbi:LysR family transcriptional regulator [Caulobacter endophyticus]|uniref:LysR family transcriptional regulator n=1 Tax=Caulobacter endophyticus TaxID=2172652 RepID=A0A2T9JY02_9CAUL|nr:LysR family transcriptional regulator [Caulobacter endophyticus]PVM88590.1 LysR family transcriptional regulator [Caulobacter endophyticus]